VDLGPDLRLLVFDFDGTLLHLDVDWAAVRRALDTGATGETVGTAIQRLRLAGDEAALAPVTDAELAGLGEARLDPAVAGTLTALATRYHLAVFTRNSRTVVERAFAAVEPPYIVGREDVAAIKPDPAGLHRVLDHFGVEPGQAVLVGDTYHDVAAAHAAGVRCVIVRNERLAYPPADADAYIESLAELAPWYSPGDKPGGPLRSKS
jgi:HAD superfamily hydrolase (TIGR01509 family)